MNNEDGGEGDKGVLQQQSPFRQPKSEKAAAERLKSQFLTSKGGKNEGMRINGVENREIGGNESARGWDPNPKEKQRERERGHPPHPAVR